MRSLPELGALISECASDLKANTVAVENAEAALERAKATQANTLQRFEALSEEFETAKAAALAKGLRQAEEPSAGEAFDARVTEAFERATTPQDQTTIFSNGQGSF